MAAPSIPVDLQNPGQVFACLGFMEAAEVLIGPTTSEFERSEPTNTRFTLNAEGTRDAFTDVLAFLATCEVEGLLPFGANNLSMSTWKLGTHELGRGQPFPMPTPEAGKPAILPARLHHGGRVLVVDHWGDTTQRDNVKFWAGAGGMPGAALLSQALDLIRDRIVEARPDPFSLGVPQKSSLRLDWRRDYVPVDAGFSLNAHDDITPRGYPLVEVLAAIGLTHARPVRCKPGNKLQYNYFVPEGRLPASFQRALLGGCDLPFPTRQFHILMSWPGKEGQARCITSVTERTPTHD